jgi:hypothetical protein
MTGIDVHYERNCQPTGTYRVIKSFLTVMTQLLIAKQRYGLKQAQITYTLEHDTAEKMTDSLNH